MSRRQREKLELRYYEVPQGEPALALLGEKWVGVYGQSFRCLHFHNLLEIGVCRSGRGYMQVGDVRLPYDAGTFTVIPANCPHCTISDGVNAWEYLFTDPAELLGELTRLREERLVVVNGRADMFHRTQYPEEAGTLDRILEEARRRRPGYQEVCRCLLNVFLLEVVRLRQGDGLGNSLGDGLGDKPGNKPEKRPGKRPDSEPGHRQMSGLSGADPAAPLSAVAPALRKIEEHYAKPMKAEDLAHCCGLSESHFRRVFKDSTGMHPMDYLNLIRVRNACRLLHRTSYAMDLVASECGFSSLSAFTRNFKRFQGVTPYQWKRGAEQAVNYDVFPSKGRDGLGRGETGGGEMGV